MQRKCAVCGQHTIAASECAECGRKSEGLLQRAAANGYATSDVPPIVHEVLRSPGQPLDTGTRAFFEPSFGHDFSDVRVHTDAKAAESAQAVHALAYTVGRNIVFDAGQYLPVTMVGQRLLAHELAHVVQQRDQSPTSLQTFSLGSSSSAAEREAQAASETVIAGGKVGSLNADSGQKLRRFVAEERGLISDFSSVLQTAQQMADASTTMQERLLYAALSGLFVINWHLFVSEAGGQSILDVLGIEGGHPVNRPANRYLVTCRCGLVDLRHFYQMMYIAIMLNNREATERGREHELEAGLTSRFAAEDSTSNALGAYFGSTLSIMFDSQPATFVSRLGDYLRICLPVDFNALPTAEQDAIVSFYADRNPDETPVHTSESATPTVLSIGSCDPASRSFPFTLAADDPHHRTISGLVSPYNLTSDAEIRNWVRRQTPETLGALPLFEMIRLINRLLDGWVSDDDLGAVERIVSGASGDIEQIRSAISPRVRELTSIGQRRRLELILGM